MKRAILNELGKGPKNDEELRRLLLGERPKKGSRVVREYDTKYVAFKRAIEDLVSTRRVADAVYTLQRGIEVTDVNFLTALLKHYARVEDARLDYVMADIDTECQKVGAVWTNGLLDFLEDKLENKNPKVRELAVSSFRALSRGLRDTHNKNDRKILEQISGKILPQVSRLAVGDPSLQVREWTINLLSELGGPEAISVLIGIVKSEPETTYKELYRYLKEALCLKYDENSFRMNRLIRDYKPTIHGALLGLTQVRDPEVRKRADVLLWHFRTGGLITLPGGEPY